MAVIGLSLTRTPSSDQDSFKKWERSISLDISKLPSNTREGYNYQLNNINGLKTKQSQTKDPQQKRALGMIILKEVTGLVNKVKSDLRSKGETTSSETDEISREIEQAESSLEQEASSENPSSTGSNTRSQEPAREEPAREESAREESANDTSSQKPDDTASAAKAQETASIVKKGTPTSLKDIMAYALLGGGALGSFLSNSANRKNQQKLLENYNKKIEEAEKELKADPQNPIKQMAYNKVLSEKVANQRKDVLEEASKHIKKNFEERQKAATDIGLNIGNFSKIFGSDTNRDSLQNITDVDRLIKGTSHKLQNYL
jgi:hypothetical protein